MYRGYVGIYVEVVGTSGSNPDRENEARATAAPSLLSNGVSLILSAPPEKKHKIQFKKILPNTASKAKLAASAQVNATEPAMGRTKARACAPVVLKF